MTTVPNPIDTEATDKHCATAVVTERNACCGGNCDCGGTSLVDCKDDCACGCRESA